LRRIGIFPKEEDKKLHFNVSDLAKEKIQKILDENNISTNNYILIHPSTRWRFKCFDKFDQLAKLLHEKNEKIIVVSGKQDYEIDMVKKIINDLPILNLAGKVNIEELAALILFSKKFYCVDSFSFHLSSALKSNVRAFFGPTCEIGFGPWQNENAKIIKSNFSCRPCSLDGCGGSKVSECLTSISRLNRFLTWVDRMNSQSMFRSSVYNQFAKLGYRLDWDNKDNLKDFKRLGQDMAKLNREAVNGRYKQTKKAEKFKFKNETVKDVQVLKSLQCLLYQCDEDSIPETKLFKALKLIEGWIKDIIIERETDYNKMEWG
ncbi:MAG: hypothetical protein K1060chlam4_01724, partial [Candidatus Anoxychlamydiales bacterium]|nr:hypothetical protein [Candidatus Anoxychlamydiales bacterium]